jgi:hypothetical protein
MRKILLCFLLILPAVSSLHAQTDSVLNFDGVDDYVTISSTINSQFAANTITLEGRFYVPAGENLITNIVGEAEMGDNKIKSVLFIEGGNVKGGYFTGAVFLQVVAPITYGQWNHAAYTFDGTDLKLYLNGIPVDTLNAPGSLPNGTEEWRIGRLWDIGVYFKGSMDEVRIWNIVRTPAEILNNMETNFNGTESGLVAYYNFNQGIPGDDNTAITSVTDLTGNYNGTPVNLALTGSTSNFIIHDVTDILDYAQEKSEIFPNPFKTDFTVFSPSAGLELKIFDSKASLVYRQFLNETTLVDPGKLPSGLYKLMLFKEGDIVEERTLMKVE